jgi:hypothetical protein
VRIVEVNDYVCCSNLLVSSDFIALWCFGGVRPIRR